MTEIQLSTQHEIWRQEALKKRRRRGRLIFWSRSLLPIYTSSTHSRIKRTNKQQC